MFEISQHYFSICIQVAPTQIREFMRSLPFMSDVTKMMKSLEEYSAEIIIISDSNSIFISELLKAADLTKYVKKVFTNPASFDQVTMKQLKTIP